MSVKEAEEISLAMYKGRYTPKETYVKRVLDDLITENKNQKSILQKCFDDSCRPSGAISKDTMLELIKIVDRSAR